ncbi:hypothetical protein [uncultured Pseudokineococcus sp.]|uniref:hypothetical protein n=1 Tax=uncultured Pseudokineococcus sp. TaxID=1642928 RepID=UPI002603B647|nr:hypothetical protein [uncultured Pseudokineococcus sp.]
MTESDARALDEMQTRLQRVLSELRRLQGRPPAEVRERLSQAIAAEGLPEQPPSWVRDSAAELSAGRLVVIGPRQIPEEAEHLEPDPDQHAAG